MHPSISDFGLTGVRERISRPTAARVPEACPLWGMIWKRATG